MKKQFLYTAVACTFLMGTMSVGAAAGKITSYDYTVALDESGKADASRTFFGWKQLKPTTKINLSFSAQAKRALIVGLRYTDSTNPTEASWVEIELGAEDNKEARVRACSAHDPRPENSITADAGMGIIPSEDQPVSYVLTTDGDGGVNITATTDGKETPTIFSMTKPWLKNMYNGYSFKTRDPEGIIIAGDAAAA